MNYRVILTLIILLTSLSINASITICGTIFLRIQTKDQTPITAIAGPKLTIKMGAPRMASLWMSLEGSSELDPKQTEFHKKLRHTLEMLSTNPFHPGLHSHKIDSLRTKSGRAVFESYMENRKSGAKRVFWVYGPGEKEITILAIENHPDKNKYDKIELDSEVPLRSR